MSGRQRGAFREVFGLVQALKGPSIPRSIETIVTYQYAISFNARDNLYLMGQGAAMAVVVVLLILVLVGLVRLCFGRQELEY
jgi:ABC-type sugar transport system permease subunit